jgi:hypothetical protein
MKISYPEDWRTIPPEKWTRMNTTPEAYAAMRAERVEREKRAPEVGVPAPDFEVERLGVDGRRTGERFKLSSTRGRPVALAFGSYT